MKEKDGDVLSHLIRRIKECPLLTDPFPFIQPDKIFPEEFYSQIQEYLPALSFFTASEKYPKRRELDLNDERIETLPFTQHAFWRHLAKTVLHLDILRALLEKFHETLKRRSLTPQSLGVSLQLVRDLSHYSIGPHTDHPKKVLSFLIYLPPGENQKHLGTSLYSPKKRSFRCEGLDHYDFDEFDKIHTAPFLPNSAFAFPKSDVSFHGVEPIGNQENERTLLNYIVWEKSV